jgi:hypothetical protein
MMAFKYDEYSAGPQTFGRRAVAVTPNDDADLPSGVVKGVVCLTSGDLSVVPLDNADNAPVNFVDVPAGFVPPFIVRRVRSTGTTATVVTVED